MVGRKDDEWPPGNGSPKTGSSTVMALDPQLVRHVQKSDGGIEIVEYFSGIFPHCLAFFSITDSNLVCEVSGGQVRWLGCQGSNMPKARVFGQASLHSASKS